MFELKRVMMYLYRSEKDNRRGLPCSFSLSLARSLGVCTPAFSPPPLQLTPEFTDLLAFCSCPLCLRSEEHSTHHLLLSWVEHPQINLDKMQQKIHEKLSSPLSLLLQVISHLTHYVLLRRMQGAMQKSAVPGKNYQATFVSTVLPSLLTSFWNLQSHFLNIWSCRKLWKNHVCLGTLFVFY